MMTDQNISFVFFGTPNFSTTILEELKKFGLIPKLIVTQEDKPQGRHLVITPPPVKLWADENSVESIQPKTLNDEDFEKRLYAQNWDLFVVVAYGKIIPENILGIPKHGTLNVHPSMLPKLRGPSPVQSAILVENETGVTIMLLDKKMDHGPIVVQEKVNVADWPPYEEHLEKTLAQKGGELLAKTIPEWVAGNIEAKEQDHESATYCKKIVKTDAFIDLSENPEMNLRKIRAYSNWPRVHTLISHNGKEIRFIIKKARLENGELIIEQVVPPGHKEMSMDEFKRGFLK